MITLRNVLRINALSSGATGLLLVLAARLVADLFGVSSTTVFIAVGIFLVVFAAFVFLEGSRSVIQAARIRLIIAADTLWVLASIAFMIADGALISTLGNVLIAGVALWVAAMAWLQWRGLRTAAAQHP